ncbi:MATE family efflux transporter [Bradyrhizobium sp. HKCCYLS3077]|uniref:MATE family efflux transporter n=1 Tax=Bradyrhizobium sp. HKCCYLS3077 TaxID=3420761 RepID=UPI003EBEFE47
MDVSTQANRPAAAPSASRDTPPAAAPPPDPSRAKAAATRAALLSGPVLPTLARLALPTMSVLVAQTAVNVAEAYYVGFLGTDALAGAALVFPIFMLMTMMSNGGIGSGVSSAVARAIGAGRNPDADAIAFHAIVLAVIAGGLFTLLTALFGPALYHALGGRAGALEAALRYSNYLFAGAIPVWIVNLQAAALRGAGNVRVPALVTLVGAVLMIPASPILIFGLGPLPGLGIAGAGIAFGLYYCGAMLVLVRTMASGRSSLHVRVAPLQLRLFADILKVGLPTALNAVLVNLTVILVTALAGRFGTSELAAYGIASRLDYIMIPILFGLCTATLTMVGINVGAGQHARARRIALTSALTGAALVGAIGCLVALHPPLWLALFSHDADVLREGAIYLRTVAPAYAALGFGFVLAFAGQGAGHVLWPFIGSAIRILIAAGGGFIAISMLGGGMASLAAMVALSLLAYALVCSLVLAPRIWRPAAP